MYELYSNIGNKVCALAKFCGICGVICAVLGLIAALYGFMDSYEEFFIFGIFAAITGTLSLVSSWPLYAFGQITNDIHEMKNKINA